MKFFETQINEKYVTWIVGENGCTGVSSTKDTVTVTVDNEKIGTITIRYNLKLLPFYGAA